MSRRVLALLVLVLSLAWAAPAAAHEERPAQFPDGTGHRPHFLGWDNPRHRVVCRGDSGAAVAALPDGAAKDRSRRLLRSCRFHSIQDAVDSVRQRNTSVYVLPGTYHESKYANAKRGSYCSHLKTQSTSPLLSSEYIGSISSPDPGAEKAAAADGETDPIALSYADQRRCAHNLNLIALFGDRTPNDDSIRCNSRYCGTQLVGTGAEPDDVIVDNRFTKLNAIRADRMAGFYLSNMTFQQSEFNSIYVMETDGFVLDHVIARGNDEYGILAFASDHGLIQDSEAYYNGDSGIYPGSGSDLNADNPDFEVTRYAIEIRRNSSHDNTLGYSGTAGNSIWAHDNQFFDNATGIATDSLFPGHPGLPQDHARWSHNDIHSNNSNWYTKYVDTGVCAEPMKDRGYLHGTVCPVVPTPVGTGVLIAGGNFDSTDHNWIYDNWRYGTMQFWVPAVLRDDYDPSHLYDTSNDNHTFGNQMGIDPAGTEQPNGMDHWWDDQGVGNCWEDNHYGAAGQTDNFTVDPPACADGGSVFLPGAAVKDAGFLSCSQYDRNDPTWSHPVGCTWFDDPTKPGARAADEPDSSAVLVAPIALTTAAVALGVGVVRRRWTRAA